ncbi:hypothetical protein HCH_01839 [Hahella chejuensis KCTC 2396]|uniref:Uncharacterized protein n=1 Tax=Hahella chejuensis (strain KCTC 2396) TaxID=349521 RepID=Q2SKZ7_HAHCH|nr:hypothetical protein HCH_01839 [Hahella chejuensis KCTC 2396]
MRAADLTDDKAYEKLGKLISDAYYRMQAARP